MKLPSFDSILTKAAETIVGQIVSLVFTTFVAGAIIALLNGGFKYATMSVREGNVCLVCEAKYTMWQPGLSPKSLRWSETDWMKQMHERKREVYVNAQAAARRRELKQLKGKGN
jgi:hypothetical protein